MNFEKKKEFRYTTSGDKLESELSTPNPNVFTLDRYGLIRLSYN